MGSKRQTVGAPLAAALIRAGNLPADEKRMNERTHDRIVAAFAEVRFGLLDWTNPDQDERG